MDKQGLYFEPSAGNGMLTVAANPQNCIVNELDPQRLTDLKFQKFKEVLNMDASNKFPFVDKFDAIITNPPFGSTESINYNDANISGLELIMALYALETMKHDGKAAIIIGGHTKWDSEGRIQAGKNRTFFVVLNELYNVEDVINVDSHALYSRQGTAFDVRIILINGKRDKPEFPPLLDKSLAVTQNNSGETVKTFEDLFIRVANLLV